MSRCLKFTASEYRTSGVNFSCCLMSGFLLLVHRPRTISEPKAREFLEPDARNHVHEIHRLDVEILELLRLRRQPEVVGKDRTRPKLEDTCRHQCYEVSTQHDALKDSENLLG